MAKATTSKYVGRLIDFTPREAQAVDLLCDGHNDESIAHQLGVDPSTAKRYLASAREKRSCNSRLELAVGELKTRFHQEFERLETEGLTVQEIKTLKRLCAFMEQR